MGWAQASLKPAKLGWECCRPTLVTSFREKPIVGTDADMGDPDASMSLGQPQALSASTRGCRACLILWCYLKDMYKHVFLHHPISVREDCWPWVSKMSTTSRCLYKGWTNMATEKNESAWRLSVVSVLSLCPRIWVRAELLLFEWKPNIGELLGSLGYGKGCVVESCW